MFPRMIMAKLEGLMKWHIGWWSVGLSAIIAFSVLSFPSVKAQESSANSKQVLTATDYAHAEQLMSYNANRLVYGAERATWLSDDRFWYRSTSPDGSEFIIVDAATGQAKSAFDHAALASALSTATGAHFDARHL